MTGEPTHLQPPQRPPRLPPVASGRRRLWLAGVLANHLLQAALALGAAFAAKTLVDGLDHRQAGAWPGDMLWPAAGVLGLVLAAGALRGLELAQSEALAQHYIAHLRLRLFDRLASLSPEGRQRRSRGGVMLRFVGDAQALRAWVGRGIAQCVAAGCALVALLAGLALWQPRLALWTLPWLVLAGVMMSLTLPPLRRAVRECRRRQAGIATNVYDRIATLPLLQATGATARERRRLQRQNRQLRQAMQRRAWARARHRWAPDLCLAGLAGSLLFAVVTGASAGGGLLVGVLGLLGLLARPLRGIGRALESREEAQVARERMLEFLAERQRLSLPRHGTQPGPSPELGFESAAVPGRLEAFTARVPHGRRVAVCGPAGAGKSTLLALAARLRDPAAGRVTLGSAPLPQVDAALLRQRISHLSGEATLVRGSVRRCLQQRDPAAPDAALLAACALAGWPQADAATLAATVRDGGDNLNGQRRRQLALAAALVGVPDVLVVDDAEHALPGPPLPALAALLERFPGTVLFATADPRLAALADEVWWLHGGRLHPAPVAAPGAAGLRVVAPAAGATA